MASFYSSEEVTKLQYPSSMSTDDNDHIVFSHFPYVINDELKRGAGRPIENIGGFVTLYMPNSTPQTPNKQAWESKTFDGELGQRFKQAAQFFANGADGGGQEIVGEARAGNFAEAGKQYALSQLASRVGLDAAGALQLGKGKVYNPNVEMLYKKPVLRQFRFTFDFLPEDGSDARATDDIIMMFKQYSAPAKSGTFLEVPHLWNIEYRRAGGGHFSRLNKFKYCVCESVMVQDNPRSNYHMTIEAPDDAGPVPVHTQIELIFTETDIVLREDHENSGYARGF